MSEIKQKVNCFYCGEKDTVAVTTKQTKYSRTVKVSKCKNCEQQNGVKQVLNNL